ncbi:MAG: T9SS type A sorting domain-containing protein, partial [Bacteroidales bacterium]|nr:T9SS type A sorting domain-containing protein [Bacteroidales bacterium]
WGDSDLVSLPQQPSIPATEALGNPVSSTLYTLSGRQLSLSNHLPAGFYLLRKQYASGAVVTEKILVQTAK